MSALARAFRQEAGSASAGDPARDGAALEKVLASLYARGREAHPRLLVDEPAFGRHLARCTSDAKAGALADLPAEDLYLACACAVRARGAATAFERTYGVVIRRAIVRVIKTADERQEAEQRAWHHIFVEDGPGPPRITQYRGRGPLESWVSVAAMRVAVSFARAESAERRLRSKVVADTAGVDAEWKSMKEQLRVAFETAVAEAVGGLKPRERLILKLHVVSGMTLEAIGKSLGVSRQAVSKTFARSREGILDEVESLLKQRLKISKKDLSSVLRIVASRLDVSISRVLANA
jgi:RNA polymerase sigma-70 factor (ECF subfamily)